MLWELEGWLCRRGTWWLCWGLTTLWRTRINRRQGRDGGGLLWLSDTQWL